MTTPHSRAVLEKNRGEQRKAEWLLGNRQMWREKKEQRDENR